MSGPTVSILERPVYGVGEAASLIGLRPDRTRAYEEQQQQRSLAA